MRNYFAAWLILSAILAFPARAETVTYELDIKYTTLNVTGAPARAMSISGQVPGPTLTARLGDTFRVTFHNRMDVETSIHWHGVLLPNDQDGVPMLTTRAIPAGGSHTFEFPIIHTGTYWYHSHTGLQEQRGVYGSLVFLPKEGEGIKSDGDHVVVFSDWNDESPDKTIANLKRDGDYYALKKDSVQSWDQVIAHGKPAIKSRLNAAWTRMGPMDISDVGYDAFLVNGKRESSLEASPGETVRLRLINAAASSYFYVEFAGGPMTIIAADGIDVEPVQVKRLRMAIAETYDVLVTMPKSMSWELRATSEDGTGHSSLWLGKGHRMPAPDVPKPNPYIMDHSAMGGMMDHGKMDHGKMDHGEMDHDTMNHREMDHNTMNHGEMDHSKMMSSGHEMHKDHNMAESHQGHTGTAEPARVIDIMTDYEALRSPVSTALEGERPLREVLLRLTGNMERYIWSFNGKTLSQSDEIRIRKGERVRFILKNDTMMHHPIHLHGHFFRVVTKAGDYSPLKHTVNVPPMDEVIIEFSADENKDWFFHCHNLYHMKSGMARVISYEGSSRITPGFLKKLSMDDRFYGAREFSFMSHETALEAGWSNPDWAFHLDFETNYENENEGEAVVIRRVSRFLDVYAGGRSINDAKEDETSNTGIFGLTYVLPLLVEMDLRVDTEGDWRAEFGSELQLTKRTRFEWAWNTDDEYDLTLGYEINKKVLLVANAKEDGAAGVGIRFKF